MGKGKYKEALFSCSSLKKGSVPGNYLIWDFPLSIYLYFTKYLKFFILFYSTQTDILVSWSVSMEPKASHMEL